MNSVIFRGNLTRDIELRYNNNSNAWATTAIAVNRRFTINGDKREEVMFMDITFFGRTAEVASQYLRKGSDVIVRGRIVFQQWQDKNTGIDRSKHSLVVEELEMLDKKDNTDNNAIVNKDNELKKEQQTPSKEQNFNEKNQQATQSGEKTLTDMANHYADYDLDLKEDEDYLF